MRGLKKNREKQGGVDGEGKCDKTLKNWNPDDIYS